ncbi:MAG: 16S rRNA (guanine(966)-N(2))-methyltransferase RsmD [Clostridia bacterium]
MRIIGGIAKGRTIYTPKGERTRPTADRIKESVFAIIQDYIPNSRVLDLFAGSGNMGLEALSRGAKGCVFIDMDRTSIEVIKKNTINLNFTTQTRVYQSDYRSALRKLQSRNETFDVIFVDPPYNRGFIQPVVAMIHQMDILDQNGIIVVEHSIHETIDTGGIPLQVKDQRKYGITMVSFIAKDVTED